MAAVGASMFHQGTKGALLSRASLETSAERRRPV